jgi:hypothetical protein
MKENIEIQGHEGTWYIIDTQKYNGKTLHLLEHETYGDETACLIVDDSFNLILDNVYNGFDDYKEWEQEQLFNNQQESKQFSIYKNPQLPARCYSVDDRTGQLIIIENGLFGSKFCEEYNSQKRSSNRKRADLLNKYLGVSKKDEAIMKIAAKTNWRMDNERINPKLFNEQGHPTKIHHKSRLIR